ncbi:MAG: TAXI family TRAP transporter solute-binding subunit [Vicinamibacterales bacterium]
MLPTGRSASRGTRSGAPRRGATRLAALLAAIATAAGCGRARAADPPPPIRFAVGSSDSVFAIVGAALAAAYNAHPGLAVATRESLNSQASADALERGEVDLALEGARTSYLAYRRGTPGHPQPHRKLRALAVLFPTVVHIAARRDLDISNVSDLRGRRVYVGERGSPTEGASRAVLSSHGLSFDDIQPFFDRARALEDFRAGRLDGLIFFFPIEQADGIAMMRGGGATLVPLDPRSLEAIRSRDPLLKPAAIPAGAYDGQLAPVPTVGSDVLLVSREDLDEDLVYTLTRTLFESAGGLRRAHRAAGFIDPGRGPGAPIPLHRGAARYYRERQLLR